MFLLVLVPHVGAHPDEFLYGVSVKSSINLGKTFPRISRIRIIPSTQIFARVFVYLPPYISQILDFICRMVFIFILIYFEWRDTENQQYVSIDFVFKTEEICNFWSTVVCYFILVFLWCRMTGEHTTKETFQLHHEG